MLDTKNLTWPSIASITNELRQLRAEFCEKGGDGLDVRLQVYADGKWAVRFGDSQYDTDHHGFWGSSTISYEDDIRDTARDLLEQAKEQEAIEIHEH